MSTTTVPRTTRGGAWLTGAATVALAFSLASCGVPEGGAVRTVDDDAVPYRLLDPETPGGPSSAEISAGSAAPAVFWVDGDQLRPESTDDVCTTDPDLLVEQLLASLTGGPSEEARSVGLSSALPTDFGLDLLTVDDDTAEIEIAADPSLSADQLPLAVAQIVLTVTTAPTIRSVVFLDDGEPVQAPLPGGALTEDPVTSQDYADFLPSRLASPGSIGCRRS